jgi:hypothetical protein
MTTGTQQMSLSDEAQPPITFREFEEKLADPTIPDVELRRYFIGDRRRSRPFAPVLQVDRDKVVLEPIDEFRVQGAFAMNWANGVSRLRRQLRFDRRRAFGEKLPLVTAEGDSWFEFPIMLSDVVDQVDHSYLVWSVAAAGDTVQNMLATEPEYLEAIRRNAVPKTFMFSGAGNDIVGSDPDGRSVIEKVVRRFEPGRPASWYVSTDAFNERLAVVERNYRQLFETVAREFRDRVSVVCHGYDRAIPALAHGDPRDPLWANRDEWLAGPLGRLGIADALLQREIVARMIDRLNEMQKRLCGGNNDGGVFRHAYHADIRGALPNVDDWADELHPTDAGYAKVAARFAPILSALV